MSCRTYKAYSIVIGLLEGTALTAMVFWLLPKFGINVPIWGLALLLVALATHNGIGYRLSSKVLQSKPIPLFHLGGRGRAVTPISPNGYVRVNGELWRASANSSIQADSQVSIVAVQGMTLLVAPVEQDGSQNQVGVLGQ